MMGNNAFFVRKDLMTPHLTRLAENPLNFNGNCKESKDSRGKPTFTRGEQRREEIVGLPVVNVLNGQIDFL